MRAEALAIRMRAERQSDSTSKTSCDNIPQALCAATQQTWSCG
jgi:hypothetical protein